MTRKAAGTLLLVHTVLTLLLQLSALAIPDLQAWLGLPTLSGLVTRAVLMQGALIFLPSLVIIGLYKLPAEAIIGGPSTPSSLILAAVVGVPAGVVFQGLNNLMLYLIFQLGWTVPAAATSTDRWSADLWQQTLPVMLVLITVRVLTPALIEELMFRGVIQSSLKSPGNLPGTAIIFWQALAFALFHNNPLFLLPPLLAGLLLGLLRQNGNSLLPSIIGHLSLNLTLLLIAPLLPQLTAQYLNLSTRSAPALFYASLIATFVAAITLIPLIALISQLRPPEVATGPGQPLQGLPVRQTGLAKFGGNDQAKPSRLPGDWKFALALLMLLVTMVVSYFQAV